MIPMSLAEIARVAGGRVERPTDADVVVTGPAYVDSRAPEPDGLFVAVLGERVDGHRFAAGAHAVLGSRATEAPTVVVADPVEALGRLARHVRDRLDATVIALTGSQGKTGTKDALTQILATCASTVGTAANLNNELGVPLTILQATPETAFLVVEMGARGVGHIDYLCGIARPDVAAVLNVGTAHLSEFGSRDRIAAAKGEIVESLGSEGTAVLNADDPRTAAMGARTSARHLTFGVGGDVGWSGLELDELGRPRFELSYRSQRCSVRLTQSGAHQVPNAAAAVALAVAAGLSFDRAARALSGVRASSRWRMELCERRDGLVVLNDAYNANPASMSAALDTLAAIGDRGARRTVAVLGEMLELGEESAAAHREVGRSAVDHGVDVVVVVGQGAREVAVGAGESDTEVVIASGRSEALAWLRNNVGSHDAVLIKASRGAALEKIADGLLAPHSTDERSEGEAAPS